MKRTALLISVIFVLACGNALAQTNAFTYQGTLTDTSLPADGTYDFQFTAYNAAGETVSATLTITGVSVANGVFTVVIDFGQPGPFSNGAAVDMLIKVKRAADGSYTPLSPRQPFTSSPYAINSLFADVANTANTANHATTATSVSGILSITNGGTGSSTKNFVDLTTAQTVDGDKTFSNTLSGSVVNAATQFNIAGSRVFSIAGANNLFSGVGAGQSNTGFGNAFVGRDAGKFNTSGAFNSFFGFEAGQANTSGTYNSFFGTGAGKSTTTAHENSFFGYFAGSSNTTGTANTFMGTNSGNGNISGEGNSFFGYYAGNVNTTGNNNSFFGLSAGVANTGADNTFIGAVSGGGNTSGFNNTFVGFGAGGNNTTGNNNTLIGHLAWAQGQTLTFATAIGAGANVGTSNTIVLGRSFDTVKIPGNVEVTGTFSGTIDGAGLTSLNASNITSGTLDNARLGVVPIENGGTGSSTQNFVDLTNTQTIGGNKNFTGVISGNGAGLNSLNGASLVDSSIPVGKLANESVNEDAIRDNNVTTDKIADGAVTASKISAGAATSANTPNTLVKRDANGDFSARVIDAENVGVGITTPSAKLSVVTGPAELAGTALSSTLRATAGNLGQNPGDELSLASIGFFSANNSSLGIRAHRTTNGSDWTTAAIGLGMDVDDTVRAGATLWLNANGNIGIGTTTPTERLNVVGNGLFTGNLTGNEVTTQTSFNVGAQKILSNAGFGNLFVGFEAGVANTLGDGNTFAGRLAGSSNTEGRLNAFFGRGAGQNNVGGNLNSFFGVDAGFANTTGIQNSFFGVDAGRANNGTNNSFFGVGAGQANVDGGNNTVIGALANVSSPGLNFATAIGAGAIVSTSDTVALGRVQDTVRVTGNLSVAGATTFSGTVGAPNFDAETEYRISGSRVLGAPGDSLFVGVGAGTGAGNTGTANSFLGRNAGAGNTIGSGNTFAGTSAGLSNQDGSNNSFFGIGSGTSNTSGTNNSFFGRQAGLLNQFGSNNTFVGTGAGVNSLIGNQNTFIGANAGVPSGVTVHHSTAIGADAQVSSPNTIVIGTATDIVVLSGGLYLRNGLTRGSAQSGGSLPLCVGDGPSEIDGIVRVCAPSGAPTKEDHAAQKARIETLQEQLKQQQAEIEAMKKFICSQNPTAEICQPKN